MAVRIKVTCSENKRTFQENRRIYRTGIESFEFSQINVFLPTRQKRNRKYGQPDRTKIPVDF